MTENDYKKYCLKEAKRLEWFQIKEDGDRIILDYDIGKSLIFNRWIVVSVWIDGWKAGFNDGREVGQTDNLSAR